MKTDRIKFIRSALSIHNAYWDAKKPVLRKYRNAYLTEFFSDGDFDKSMIQVQTSDGYALIESIMGSLFSKYPSVELKDDMKGDGDKFITKELANNFLRSCREQIENASRMALIYPQSFLKLAPVESEQLTGAISMRAVPPWQIILDRDAADWNDCRFIGHTYFLPIEQANEKFGNKKWVGVQQRDFFTERVRGHTDEELPNEYLYIEIVEMYDFINNELLFWSSQWKNGDELLSRDEIPITSYDDKPMSNIIPLYFSKHPDRPMDGYSTLSRNYDQIFEKNILRTFWANAVRRDTRQYIYKEGAFDEEALAKISAGVDGAFIPTNNDTLSGLIDLIPVAPLSSNQGNYLNYIEADIERGSLTASFTRGEASKATATEISTLQQYTASELGKLARSRDDAIEMMILTYIRMLIPLLKLYKNTVIKTKEGAKIVTVEAIDADWTFYSTDSASTPVSDIIKKKQLIELFPILGQLGISPDAIKEEIVRLFDLPPHFIETAAPSAPPVSPASPASPAIPGI